MGKKAGLSVAVLLVLAVGAAAQAEVFVDDFNTPHDYVKDGVAGTMWDDFIGWMPGETVDALNASMDRPGQLFIESTNGVWDSPWNPLGPFLFKVVRGDFIATVKVTDYAGDATTPVFHNDGGLMARAFTDDAGAGEDWISIDYFPIWSCGNFLWQADNNVRNEAWGCNNGKQWNLDPWLQLERNGAVFHVRTSKDGVNWTEMSCSPKTRTDLRGVPLMVGLRHATYNTTQGYVAFDDFTLDVIVRLKAYDPVPADRALNVSVSKVTWKPGDFAAKHDVYIGTSLDDVNNATTSSAGIYKGRQDPNSLAVADLDPGTTYYWRIDEVNDAHPDKLWKGDVWSFTPVSLAAWNPSPADDAGCVLTSVDLTWNAGATALLHEVYFGTSETAVATATPTNLQGTVYKKQTGTTYKPSALAKNTTYFWRVDELDKAAVRYKGATWSFTTLADIAISDTHLVGWWKLDGGCTNNDIVVDSSGYNRHGRMVGEPQMVPGYDGDALRFDGRDDYVELPIGDLIGSLTNSSFLIWADFANSGGAWQRIWDFGNDPNVHMFFTPRKYYIDPMRFCITKTGTGYQIAADAGCVDGTTTLPSGWHHVAVTIDATTSTIILYLDAVEVTRGAAAFTPKDLGVTTNNWLGRSQYEDDATYMGSLDEFRIYDQVLSPEQIARAMGGDPLRAWAPSPANGASPDVEHVSTLSWSAGQNASKHDLYFALDVNALNAADVSDTAGIYRGRLDLTTYSLTDVLELNQRCYWRVDEVDADGTVVKGNTWVFTTAPYLVVDDFESYGGEDTPGVLGGRVWYVWNDGFGWTSPEPGSHGNGTGAIVDVATTPVHGGRQALRFDYDNDRAFANIFGESIAPYVSEVNRTFDPPQDWTRRTVKRLIVWFYGSAGNLAEPLYVRLQDSGAGEGVVNYGNTTALTEASWHQWTINLSEFAQTGVNLSGIKAVTIGVGQDNVIGGYGTLYIDDVRLNP
jgi:hypothetical protein